DLQEGDTVVHISHGIAKYMGMKTMRKGDSRKSEEFLTLRFAESATMHVPVTQIDLVQKYVGAKGQRPPLSKLGGTRWKTTKERVEEAVTDLASDLLRIQAERESQPGIAFPNDTHWQTEFENAFLYTETPDQITAVRDIKADQSRMRPMDRLLCGDVGYGKTELAMRAAFKTVEFGKQVAVLVPTTVLAEQHYRTMTERMADYPFRIECLNRFRSPKQQKEIVAAARKGQVDILIGTHRIVSKDVGFADLGLVIVDEEQRFGVEHKERLKRLRSTVDVLTLTATPIPRTLHMAMVGLRDISSLATPPMDRRSISTRICNWGDDLVREAVVRELNRDGQIFFVHNRVHSIQGMADRIACLVPDARIVIGHGQMSGDDLERIMLKFIRHEADILVCTTIIEAGLDIPNANTIFIDRADRFGLADLHQLRGRVGRYKHRAYCYLLLSPDRPLTNTAARRLKAIEEFSDLGAGFRIAMRDLEIRGAGNILGSEQSGQIAAVGYELYCQLLEKSVKRMRGEPHQERVGVHLELDVEAYIPKAYIASDRQRMECYRRFAACRAHEDVDQLSSDLTDAYGAIPETVNTLLSLAEIRVRASQAGITTIMKKEPDVVFQFDGEIKRIEPYFTGVSGDVSLPDGRTLHWRPPDHYFHGDTLLVILRNLFRPPAAQSQELHAQAPRRGHGVRTIAPPRRGERL
ncbi:MAG: transcription-repair coupling factor, partial [Phycisphaerae bacterium]